MTVKTLTVCEKRPRLDLGTKKGLEYPHLTRLQPQSYIDEFLQLGVEPSKRLDIGLHAELQSSFPISSSAAQVVLEYDSYTVGEPSFHEHECKVRGLTYSAPLRAKLRLVYYDKEVGKFKVISQSSIASGIRRVEALRDKQLEEYEKTQSKDKSKKESNLKKEIELIKKDLQKLKIKPDYKENLDLSENLKILTKQLNKLRIESIKKDKSKNIIKDKKIGNILIREQILKDFPPKELRSIIDQGKKDIKSGIIISISTFEDKVGLAVGISQDLTSKYDAVDLVKAASTVLGGKGGGGRKDFAQAGGVDQNKIEEAFKEISKKIS